MKAVALLARKGGSGKTTCAIHMGVLASASGQRVIFFDLDPQGSLSAWWQTRPGDTPTLVQTDARRLPDLLKAAEDEGYNLAVVDTPPAVTFDTARVAQVADLALIPLRPSILDIYAVSSTADVVIATKTPRASGAQRLPGAPRIRRCRRDRRGPPRAGGYDGTCRRDSDRPTYGLHPRAQRWRGSQRVRAGIQGRGRDGPAMARSAPESVMTKKPTSLDTAMARKNAATVSEPPPRAGQGATRTLTLRLPELVHEQLREISFKERKSQHALLLEGLNVVLERRGKPPIAE